MKNFETFGVMLDMSRNAVMKVDALKKYMQMIKKLFRIQKQHHKPNLRFMVLFFAFKCLMF